MIYSFGLAIANYLIDYNGYKLVLENGYENYNPIANLRVEKNGMSTDPLYVCQLFIEIHSPDTLRVFIHSLKLN